MGMIQIDIDMPTDCASCWIRQNMGCKIANASGWLNNKRDDKCPLKEQEAVEPKHNPLSPTDWFCGKCGMCISRFHDYCPSCGQAVKWE